MSQEDHDPIIQSLFNEAEPTLDGEVFTSQVMARTDKLKFRIIAGLICIALIVAVSTWLLALPIQELSQLITQLLATTLVELGDSTLAWVLSPVNNVAGLLVLSAKVARMIWKRFRNRSYSY